MTVERNKSELLENTAASRKRKWHKARKKK